MSFIIIIIIIGWRIQFRNTNESQSDLDIYISINRFSSISRAFQFPAITTTTTKKMKRIFIYSDVIYIDGSNILYFKFNTVEFIAFQHSGVCVCLYVFALFGFCIIKLNKFKKKTEKEFNIWNHDIFRFVSFPFDSGRFSAIAVVYFFWLVD